MGTLLDILQFALTPRGGAAFGLGLLVGYVLLPLPLRMKERER